MRDHASEALALAQDMTRVALDGDRVRALALVQLPQIIGEAAARVPADTRAAHPEVHWKGWVGLRGRLTHDYDAVDYDILWTVLSVDLRRLRTSLHAILGS